MKKPGGPLEPEPARRVKRRRRPRPRASCEASCPYCGEAEEVYVDAGGGESQEYVEDCAVCCRPRVVHVEPGEAPGEVRVWLERAQ